MLFSLLSSREGKNSPVSNLGILRPILRQTGSAYVAFVYKQLEFNRQVIFSFIKLFVMSEVSNLRPL